MKKVIHGKVYDTSTARLVFAWDNGALVNDFGRVDESLFRKKTNEYFLHAEGGAATKYAEPRGNNTWIGGETIIPLDDEAARSWAEDHMDADAYEDEFGDPGEGEEDESGMTTIAVDRETAARLRGMATDRGESIGAVVRALVEEAK